MSVCGILVVTCLFVLALCTLKVIQAPDFADIVLICGASLPGVDTVVNPFTKTKEENTDDKNKE